MHRVSFVPDGLTTRAPDGASILAAANWAGLPIDSVCGGRGTCGKCRVKVSQESGSDVSDWVLACRTPVHRDCTVEVPRMSGPPRVAPMGLRRNVAVCPNVQKIALKLAEPSLGDPRSDLQRLRDALRSAGHDVQVSLPALRQVPCLLRESRFFITAVLCGNELIAIEPGDTSRQSFGLALDIGTTTIAGAIANLQTGAVAASDSVLNSQVMYGADVITRISYAAQGRGLTDLQECLRKAINELVGRLLERCNAKREHLYEAVAVGNATVLHLLLGIDPSGIGVSPFVPGFHDPISARAADLGIRLHPEARLSTLPILGAYVGADTVAGLLATELMRHEDNRLRLFVDVGTNGEIALRRGNRCLCAAAPAGPAFEGAQIHCGMRAIDGAIEHVEITDDVHLKIVGGAERPAGICGSGLIDAVAELRRCGLVHESGRLAHPEEALGDVPEAVASRLVAHEGSTGFLLSGPEDGILVTQADVRALQYAKAAIGAGTDVLLSKVGARREDIDEVQLAGAFGSYINAASARAIGLVPWVTLERIRAVGNSAQEGALIALISRGERQASSQMPRYVDYLELSADPEFNHHYREALAFPRGPATPDSRKT